MWTRAGVGGLFGLKSEVIERRFAPGMSPVNRATRTALNHAYQATRSMMPVYAPL